MSKKGNAIREHNVIHRYKEPRSILISEYLDEAANLLDAKDEGRLIELPCKVGDTFWWIERLVGDDKPFIRSGQVSEIGISDAITIYEYDGRDFSIEDVYFTREEAESALAEENFFIE